MEGQPLVSIIIPTYNRAHLIGETLDSVLAQTYSNWECIIVDDGSSDNTDEVVGAYVKKDARFKYFHRPDEHLPGGNGARNYGLKMSQGEYVQWFDSDDLMNKDFLSKKINFFSNSIDVVLCYGAYFEGDKQDITYFPSKPKTTILNPMNYVKTKCHLSIAGPLWRKSFLDGKVLFDEKRAKLQDREFHFRMILYNPKYYFYADEFLYKIRRTLNSVSSNKNLTTKKAIDVFTFHYLTFRETFRINDESRYEYGLYTKKKIFDRLLFYYVPYRWCFGKNFHFF